ncbi:uncharacterized protein EV420DRAFT_1473780 [Desarmillaria tabescens]|uniref:Uncharacterized protein n=1 Tax=Armillaria tabescens TaxID=1929756 RepID=A0AA39U6K7_ARMTA|nr:uncharacterized protein EV420DRAFT_1473780 [Desarmillaria tabescens]KAK0468000.1 hypothetical protein EV420DRAFT_1473780 [Desarmillaria tabescens]
MSGESLGTSHMWLRRRDGNAMMADIISFLYEVTQGNNLAVDGPPVLNPTKGVTGKKAPEGLDYQPAENNLERVRLAAFQLVILVENIEMDQRCDIHRSKACSTGVFYKTSATLRPRWWKDTSNVQILASGNAPFLATLPAGAPKMQLTRSLRRIS